MPRESKFCFVGVGGGGGGGNKWENDKSKEKGYIGARYLSLTTKNFKYWIMHIQQHITDMNPRSATSLNMISLIHSYICHF